MKRCKNVKKAEVKVGKLTDWEVPGTNDSAQSVMVPAFVWDSVETLTVNWHKL